MSPRTAAPITAAAISLAMAALIGCSSSSSSPAATSPGPSTPASSSTSAAKVPSTSTNAPHSSTAPHNAATITINNYAYRVTGTVMPGAMVRIVNDDATTHTVTADSGHGFDVTVDAGKAAALTAPSKPGSYKFHCDFHADMHATLIVK